MSDPELHLYTDPLPVDCWCLKMGLVSWSRLLFQQAYNYTPVGGRDRGSLGCIESAKWEAMEEIILVRTRACEKITDSLCFTKGTENEPFIRSSATIGEGKKDCFDHTKTVHIWMPGFLLKCLRV